MKNDLIDDSVITTPKLNCDNNKDFYHDIGDEKPTLISGNKEVLLDVTELENIMLMLRTIQGKGDISSSRLELYSEEMDFG
ncbi:hypothetical protein CEXT_709691 [Caerostris extrusa]|uniref:Uncharacterized protein n=1 Tax=Caerostris extrusa TaxID=172846 RepID=A0AAV4Y460_CAEEX|nr:hypothetical protein CEXT_709691 [Caerostris extrusa]